MPLFRVSWDWSAVLIVEASDEKEILSAIEDDDGLLKEVLRPNGDVVVEDVICLDDLFDGELATDAVIRDGQFVDVINPECSDTPDWVPRGKRRRR